MFQLVRVIVLLPVLVTFSGKGELAVPFPWLPNERYPLGPTFRMTCPEAAELMMYTEPVESTATPVGVFNCAFCELPPSPVYPAVPVPATVRMTPVMYSIRR